MAPPGIEMTIAAVQHERFGSVVMVGAGGILVDVIADRAFRLAPAIRRRRARHGG
jgi:acyl-CoA synthetase (NDP forming)